MHQVFTTFQVLQNQYIEQHQLSFIPVYIALDVKEYYYSRI